MATGRTPGTKPKKTGTAVSASAKTMAKTPKATAAGTPRAPTGAKPAKESQKKSNAKGKKVVTAGAVMDRPENWILRLYVAGQTPNSLTAFENLKKICAVHLAECYEIEVIDLLKHPQLAKDHQIVAVPTLIRKLPTPVKKIIGNLSDTEKVLVGLDLRKVA